MGLYTNLGFRKYKSGLKKSNKEKEQKNEMIDKIENKVEEKKEKKKSYFKNIINNKTSSSDYRKRFKVGNIVMVFKKNGQVFLERARVKQIPKKDMMYVVDLNGPIHDYGDHKAYMITDKKFDVKKI